MDNIETFNYRVGYIFAELQRTFPRRTEIDTLKMLGAERCPRTFEGGQFTGLYLKDGEIVDLKEEILVARDTVRWLIDTGYLIGTESHDVGAYRCFVTLSPKAMEILKISPSNTKTPGKSIGDELEDAFKSEAKTRIAGLAGEGLSMIFRLGMGAVGL